MLKFTLIMTNELRCYALTRKDKRVRCSLNDNSFFNFDVKNAELNTNFYSN